MRQAYEHTLATECDRLSVLEKKLKEQMQDDLEAVETKYAALKKADQMDREIFDQKLKSKYQSQIDQIEKNTQARIDQLNQYLEDERAAMEGREIQRKSAMRQELSEFEEKFRKSFETKMRSLVDDYESQMRKKDIMLQQENEKWNEKLIYKEKDFSEQKLQIEQSCRDQYEKLLEKAKQTIQKEYEINEIRYQAQVTQKKEQEIRELQLQEKVEREKFEEKLNRVYEKRLISVDVIRYHR